MKRPKVNLKKEKVLDAMHKELEKAMLKSAIYLQGHIKRKVGKGGGKPHRPSRPGEPPRRDTGVLASSIAYNVWSSRGTITARVGADVDKLKKNARRIGTTVDYALYLELGTANMARRPWLEPSVRECKKKISQILKNASANGIRYINRTKRW
ncbi:MAG TPA: hypothetical protein PLX18_11530 [Anaerohalosphaeraceae bacterium]|nr:hypothetical protein [Anaerohalosphaeraceae bacterium]HOT74029.1 hypothetical protein [Anaerohalosphaeraceae bacterium]HQG06812.1 hypothetical protein [Anaerohalosphaeraceae bacterium]HQI08473.1 hypothetical protein [Anaerohalosphaeraceae bacterium]HQJ68907.1 hypothetical protein [Anaerohalosphaeraceae bacterium]